MSFSGQWNTAELLGKPLDTDTITRVDVQVQKHAAWVDHVVYLKGLWGHEQVLYVVLFDLYSVGVDKVDYGFEYGIGDERLDEHFLGHVVRRVGRVSHVLAEAACEHRSEVARARCQHQLVRFYVAGIYADWASKDIHKQKFNLCIKMRKCLALKILRWGFKIFLIELISDWSNYKHGLFESNCLYQN